MILVLLVLVKGTVHHSGKVTRSQKWISVLKLLQDVESDRDLGSHLYVQLQDVYIYIYIYLSTHTHTRIYTYTSPVVGRSLADIFLFVCLFVFLVWK